MASMVHYSPFVAEDVYERLQRARNALALFQDLAAGQKRTTPPTVEVNQDELADFLSLVLEQLDMVATETHPGSQSQAAAVRQGGAS